MAAGLTVGVTAARYEACKRGLAVNLAATVARHADPGHAVCLVDVDPVRCDVGTRLAVTSPTLGWFAAGRLAGSEVAVAPRSIHRLAHPGLYVLPCDPGVYDVRFAQAGDVALRAVREAFDTVVVDLPLGTARPGPTLDSRLADRVDWLLIATTPDRSALAATLHHLELLRTARERGQIAPEVKVGVVLTGDEGTARLDPDDVRDQFDDLVVGVVPQLWGRALPNHGFGPTLGVPSLDGALAGLVDVLRQRDADLRTLPARTRAPARERDRVG